MTETAQPTPWEKLRARFNVEDHKTNPRGYTYIAIEKVINRFMEIDPEFSSRVVHQEYGPIPGQTYGRQQKLAAYALVTVEVTINGVTRAGTGGDNGAFDDVDKLIKTAYAEAVKKAGHQFGVGLYLWDEEERALIESAQQQGLTGQVQAAAPPAAIVPQVEPVTAPAEVAGAVTNEDLDALKAQVAAIAQAAGVQITGPALSAHFGVPIEALQDANVLRQIIERNAAG